MSWLSDIFRILLIGKCSFRFLRWCWRKSNWIWFRSSLYRFLMVWFLLIWRRKLVLVFGMRLNLNCSDRVRCCWYCRICLSIVRWLVRILLVGQKLLMRLVVRKFLVIIVRILLSILYLMNSDGSRLWFRLINMMVWMGCGSGCKRLLMNCGLEWFSMKLFESI